MIVLDASAWIRALVDVEPEGDAARAVLAGDRDWAGPSHLPVETLRVLARLERQGLLTTERAATVAAVVGTVALRVVPLDRALLDAVWTYRHNLSAYDAVYAALSVRLEAPLVTSDLRLARAAAAVGAETVVPGRT